METKEIGLGPLVIEQLGKRGIESFWEYPGYIRISTLCGCFWAFGNENETWGGNLCESIGEPYDERDDDTCVDLGVDSKLHKPWLIADLIADRVLKFAIKNQAMTPEGISEEGVRRAFYNAKAIEADSRMAASGTGWTSCRGRPTQLLVWCHLDTHHRPEDRQNRHAPDCS